MIPGFISQLFRRRRGLLVWYFVTSLGKAFTSVLLIVMIQQFLAVSHHKQGRFVGLIQSTFGESAVFAVMAALLVAVHLFSSVLGYYNRITTQKASEIIEIGVMEQIIRNLLSLSLQFFKQQSEGDLVQAVRMDVVNVRSMTNAYASIIRSAMLALGLTAVVFWLSPLLAFVALILLPFVTLPMLGYSAKKLRLSSRKLRSTGFVLFDTILQIISGIRIIKAYGAEETEARLSVEKGRVYFQNLMDVVRVKSMMAVLLESVGGLSLVAVIAVGGYEVSRGKLTWEGMVAFVFATRSLFGPLYEIYGSISDIHTYEASVDRIQQLLAARPTVAESPNARSLPVSPSKITFDNVSFGYGGPPVLTDIDFEVHAGETIGIVGPSGAGKSTLLNLIVRFYDPTSGAVRFDGSDLRDFKLSDVYGQMAIVTQDPFLFATTVRENIRCARPDATDAEVEAAAEAASVIEDIMNLPQGFETPIGSGGRELSRGQGQRVNVARALLRNSRLLLLDEATASLDSVAEAQVQHSIDRLMQGRTCFIVAHRLSTLRNADRLIVLDRGRCIGFGTHDELIRNCPLYRQFWDLQQLREVDMQYMSSMLSTTA